MAKEWWKSERAVHLAAWGYYTAALRGECPEVLNLHNIASWLAKNGVYGQMKSFARMEKINELARKVYVVLEKVI